MTRIFTDPRFSILWFVVRVWLGLQWVEAGWEKVFGERAAAWVGPQAGAAVKGFLLGALEKTGGPHPAVQPWYGWIIEHAFLPSATFLSYLVAYGEVLVGLALIVGFLTRPAAFFGALMNLLYMLAGTTSTNPILYTAAILILAAGTNATLYGVDRYVEPLTSGFLGRRKTGAGG